jgi:hypothetical protein
MTTKVHIVNFGPNAVVVHKVDPTRASAEPVLATSGGADPIVHQHESIDLYVHSTQSLAIIEKPSEK